MRRYLSFFFNYIYCITFVWTFFLLLFKNETYFHPEICKAHLGHFRLCVFDSYGSPVGGDQEGSLERGHSLGRVAHVLVFDKSHRRAAFCVHTKPRETRKTVHKSDKRTVWVLFEVSPERQLFFTFFFYSFLISFYTHSRVVLFWMLFPALVKISNFN